MPVQRPADAGNLDRGSPSEEASWELTFPDPPAFLRHVGGGSHQGVGCTVDGIEYRNGHPAGEPNG